MMNYFEACLYPFVHVASYNWAPLGTVEFNVTDYQCVTFCRTKAIHISTDKGTMVQTHNR